MPRLVVAANSARLLAQLARAEGHEVIALDLFGDADTRRAALAWHPIGVPASLRIDGDRVLAALRQAAGDGAFGWIAGAGFEGRPEVLESGARLLPLIGTGAEQVRRVRDPRRFFARIEALGVAYPLTQLEPPAQPRGWLLKDPRGTGGWHIRAAETLAERAPREAYYQREAAGLPMSATFVANGSGALVLGHNRLIVRRCGARPHVYAGAIGPVAVPGSVAREANRIVQALVLTFELRGFCSLDYLLDDERIAVLEVNPRPPASLALYRERLPIVASQLRACLGGELPAGLAEADGLVRAERIVYARRAFALDTAAAAQLQTEPDVHDQPLAGAHFEAGDPVFSLSACGRDADALVDHLRRRRAALLNDLEASA